MKFYTYILFLSFTSLFFSCKKKEINVKKEILNNQEISYAKGFSIESYKNFSILKITNPWPKANKNYTYILRQKNAVIPDSLKSYVTIEIPVKRIVVTSTTHIPSLEMLEVANTLVGFPHLDYISSEKVRARIDAKQIIELGNNQDLDIEKIISLSPDVIVGYGIDNNNPTIDNLEKSGQKVVFNGDWNEETPLGKAEWIKFFGALYGLDKKAKTIFDVIAKDYQKTKKMAANTQPKPTVLAGAMYQDDWFMPKGESWGSLLLADANANYLWSKTKGTGSLNLSFETVLAHAKTADFWFQGQFSTLAEVEKANSHYKQFDAVKNKKVYTFGSKKGKTGGLIYYELAPNRPDLVLKDMVKILHPELFPSYNLTFYEQLK